MLDNLRHRLKRHPPYVTARYVEPEMEEVELRCSTCQFPMRCLAAAYFEAHFLGVSGNGGTYRLRAFGNLEEER